MPTERGYEFVLRVGRYGATLRFVAESISPREQAEDDLRAAARRLFAMTPKLEDRLRYLDRLRREEEAVARGAASVAPAAPLVRRGRPPKDRSASADDEPASPLDPANAIDDNQKSLKILELMEKQPGIDFKQMALVLYGEANTNTVARIRSLLQNLKKRGFVTIARRGLWKLRATPASEVNAR